MNTSINIRHLPQCSFIQVPREVMKHFPQKGGPEIWVVISNIACFPFSPYLGKWSNLTHIFAKGLKPPTSYLLNSSEDISSTFLGFRCECIGFGCAKFWWNFRLGHWGSRKWVAITHSQRLYVFHSLCVVLYTVYGMQWCNLARKCLQYMISVSGCMFPPMVWCSTQN